MAVVSIPVMQTSIGADTANTGGAAVIRASDGTVNVGPVNATALITTGYLNLAVTTKTTTATVDGTATVWLGDATGGAFAITLPAASAVPNRVYAFVKTDSSGNAVTVTGAGGDTINGFATVALSAQYAKTVIVSNGTTWFKLV